jgi:small subunit ribosomal protein S20
MPVTKTAKRALRGSMRKAIVNSSIISKLEVAIRLAKKVKTISAVKIASSLADRAAKKKIIHKNKAARIKSSLSKLAKPEAKAKSKPAKKVSKKK